MIKAGRPDVDRTNSTREATRRLIRLPPGGRRRPGRHGASSSTTARTPRTRPRRSARSTTDSALRHPSQPGEERPLVRVGSSVQEDARRVLAARRSGFRNPRAAMCSGSGKPVVPIGPLIHGGRMAPRSDGSVEEYPDMTAIPGAGAFQGGGRATHAGHGIGAPCRPVEVDHHKVAGLVEQLDTHHKRLAVFVRAQQGPRLASAVTARTTAFRRLDARLAANARHPLVAARRGATGPTCGSRTVADRRPLGRKSALRSGDGDDRRRRDRVQRSGLAP